MSDIKEQDSKIEQTDDEIFRAQFDRNSKTFHDGDTTKVVLGGKKVPKGMEDHADWEKLPIVETKVEEKTNDKIESIKNYRNNMNVLKKRVSKLSNAVGDIVKREVRLVKLNRILKKKLEKKKQDKPKDDKVVEKPKDDPKADLNVNINVPKKKKKRTTQETIELVTTVLEEKLEVRKKVVADIEEMYVHFDKDTDEYGQQVAALVERGLVKDMGEAKKQALFDDITKFARMLFLKHKALLADLKAEKNKLK